jgi:hypothetical protein
MKRSLAIVVAALGWFALIAQYYLMIQNRTTSICETTVRFFSFFTILTNILVAIYFSIVSFSHTRKPAFVYLPGILTSISVYITIVGLVYQVALRHLWHPQGVQKIVDELLHTVIPILVIIFWYLWESKQLLQYSEILKWAIYPLAYLVYILLRGLVSNFYPYPFVDVARLGLSNVLLNIVILVLLFLALSSIFIFVDKRFEKDQETLPRGGN